MQKLEVFKCEINKCSKCGLCQSVCPIYKLTGNDCAVSRGKFVMLEGVLKGDLKLNQNINKYLDLCLKCNKCSDFCPSAIDVCKIFETAKYEYAKNTFWGKFVFFLESKFVFGNFLKIGQFLKKFMLLNSCFNVEEGVAKRRVRGENLKLLYFKGCVNNIFPQADRFLHRLFDNSNVEIIEKDFDCCGLPFLSSGNLERFEEVKKHNLALMDCDFDYVLTDCASCESTLKKYFQPTGNDVGLESPTSDLSLRAKSNEQEFYPKNSDNEILRSTTQNDDIKFINLGELIAQQDIKFKFQKPIKVTFHKPCHLENDDFWQKILANCENVEYVKMQDYDECCGFSGEFAIKNPKIATKLMKQKAQNAVATEADYVVTTCPACIIGLKRGLMGVKKSPKVVSLSDFLSLASIKY